MHRNDAKIRIITILAFFQYFYILYFTFKHGAQPLTILSFHSKSKIPLYIWYDNITIVNWVVLYISQFFKSKEKLPKHWNRDLGAISMRFANLLARVPMATNTFLKYTLSTIKWNLSNLIEKCLAPNLAFVALPLWYPESTFLHTKKLFCGKKCSAAHRSEQKYLNSSKKPIAPHPPPLTFKFNGRSLYRDLFALG